MRLELQVKYFRPKEGLVKKITEGEETDEKGFTRAERFKYGLETDEDIKAMTGAHMEENPFQFFDAKNLEYFYKPYVVKLEDIHDFWQYDEEHIMICSEFGGNLPVKIRWEAWKALWKMYTKEEIYVALA